MAMLFHHSMWPSIFSGSSCLDLWRRLRTVISVSIQFKSYKKLERLGLVSHKTPYVLGGLEFYVKARRILPLGRNLLRWLVAADKWCDGRKGVCRGRKPRVVYPASSIQLSPSSKSYAHKVILTLRLRS